MAERVVTHKTLPLRVLSPWDWQHWITWGYVIVKKAVPAATLARHRALLWDFKEMDPARPETWSRARRGPRRRANLYSNSGFISIYNHQYLWDNRQYKRVYDAFVDVWDREALWVTIDRANLNPPNRKSRPFGGFIHWDVDTTRDDLPMSVQGVLSLVDSERGIGGFQCVPEIFRSFDAWRAAQPAERNPYFPDLRGQKIVRPRVQAGDLIIFNGWLPHGIDPNRSANHARLAQYITMFPADEGNETLRQARVQSWRDGAPAPGFPRDPRRWEKLRYPRAKLSPLGERLLGLRRWDE
jgi:ectoine hydroxylase-related dioxygenase (phytanoyl-CoA dioxygenase family)